MATIVDVAKKAEVSVATVSRVINGKSRVGPKLEERVRDAIASLGYEPNPVARSLRKNETRTISILAPNVTNPYYANIIAGIGTQAHESGYSAFLFNTEGSMELGRQTLDRMRKRLSDGAILLATDLGNEWLRQYVGQYPIVQCSEFDPDIPIPHVSVDNYLAAVEVMEYLISLGHRRIGTISSSNRFYSTKLRLKGYLHALESAGIPSNDDYIRYGAEDYSFKSGYQAAMSLLTREERPTALFCISDMLALGAIAGARELGFRVPEDVTIVGFDDVEHTTMFHPYVTTVVQPCYDIGRTAMQMLLMLLGRQEAPLQVVLPHKLVVRESSSACQRSNLTDFTAFAKTQLK